MIVFCAVISFVGTSGGSVDANTYLTQKLKLFEERIQSVLESASCETALHIDVVSDLEDKSHRLERLLTRDRPGRRGVSFLSNENEFSQYLLDRLLWQEEEAMVYRALWLLDGGELSWAKTDSAIGRSYRFLEFLRGTRHLIIGDDRTRAFSQLYSELAQKDFLQGLLAEPVIQHTRLMLAVLKEINFKIYEMMMSDLLPLAPSDTYLEYLRRDRVPFAGEE